MQKTLEVENVKCGGCAATLKKKLAPLFGEVEVDLEVHPRRITLEMEEEQMDALRTALREIGYPLSSDELGFVQTASTKVKSFVSCATGRMDKGDTGDES